MFHCLLTYVYLTFHFQCKPELKVPGLYVVDSIVRQSRHQFGVDKDVFGPRFLKNFTDTFQNLYHCPEDDKVIIFWLAVLEINEKNKQTKKHNCFIMGWLFFLIIRAKFFVFWTCGKRMVCLTWISFSLWWIWRTESLSLLLLWKVNTLL